MVVLLMIGNSAITVAQAVSATGVFFTRMMISGATATIGMTCNNTAYGRRLISIQRLWMNRKAVATPRMVASAKAANVIFSVLPSACSKSGQSFSKLPTMSDGAGNKYTGT